MSRPASQKSLKRLKSSQSSRSQRSLPPTGSSRSQTPTQRPPHRSSTAPEPIGPGRVQSPLADLRPVIVAPSLPPMVPSAWGGDPDNPLFKAPSFETIGKPIRLRFCKEWYEDLFGVAARSIPDILDASNWLPSDAPVRLRLPSNLKEKLGIQEDQSCGPPSRPSTASTTEGGHPKMGKKRRKGSDWQVQMVSEVAADERHWAAVRLQCKVRSWAALRAAGMRRTRREAQIRIASCYRGYLTRTGRGGLVHKALPDQVRDLLPAELAARLRDLDPWSEELDLRHMCLGQTGSLHLAPFADHLQSLQILELRCNYMGSKGLAPLVKILGKQWDLKYLGLAWNGLGDESCVHLAKILRDHSRLRHVDLRHNRIGDAGATRLARAIKGQPALEQLDLQDNALATAGAEALYAACGKRLTVNVQSNAVPAEKIAELEKSMKEARDKLHLTAFGGRGGTPGSRSGLRTPAREGRPGSNHGGKSPGLRSPARSRGSSTLPGTVTGTVPSTPGDDGA